MGNCWGFAAHSPSPSTTGQLSSAGISHTTSNTTSFEVSNATSSRGSNISAHSHFSAGSGDEEFPNGQILPTPNLRIFSFAELKANREWGVGNNWQNSKHYASYTAKLSDFGLAKLGPSASQSHVTTRVMGTYGYAAPEYVATEAAKDRPVEPRARPNLSMARQKFKQPLQNRPLQHPAPPARIHS
ncbi:hypothetical protein OIU79_021737 [Salix purpurea]|uniref:Uncharacterized protein n=1 Tax=Salix purpurea TaxID=77065 RepID=A0A9Q0WH02_SALPP|nr:hypothetical protein OIU79_021737 [Salix purpurea]